MMLDTTVKFKFIINRKEIRSIFDPSLALNIARGRSL